MAKSLLIKINKNP